MARSIAFLRAINVGGRVVKMDELRGLFEGAGFRNVESFIASGNIIFDAERGARRTVEKKIEKALRDALSYDVDTFVRSAHEVSDAAAHNPFPDETEGGCYIAFLADEPDAEAVERLLAFSTDVDRFHVHGREAYWYCRIRSSDSKFTLTHLERALGMKGTMRNVTTVRKLAARYQE